jgi:hypothetical protein
VDGRVYVDNSLLDKLEKEIFMKTDHLKANKLQLSRETVKALQVQTSVRTGMVNPTQSCFRVCNGGGGGDTGSNPNSDAYTCGICSFPL